MTPDGSLQAIELESGDEALQALPQAPAIFLIAARSGKPYLARTSMLRRRAMRLLARRETPSRMLNLREAFTRLDYWLTGSQLDSSMKLYELAREHFPAEYPRFLRLRKPPYVKLLLANAWPRTMVTPHISGARSIVYGPFRNRAAAEAFEAQCLDLFQIRRCQEDLAPSPEHPGCIYGEMGKCLRPCQVAVGTEEYSNEVSRASEFLKTNGKSMVRAIMAAREQLSAEMEFEEAARQHRRLEKVEQVLKLRDDLAGDVEGLQAAAVTRAVVPNAVDLFFLRDGQWQGSRRIDFELEDGKPVSIDRKLREAWSDVTRVTLSNRERQERLAILARWFYSTWRDGELLVFGTFEEPPVRKLVNAIARVMDKS